MAADARPRVLVVEPHRDMRQRVVCELSTDCEVVGAVADGVSALEAIDAVQPDVLVIDVSLPDLDGVNIAKQLRRAGSQVSIVLLAGEDGEALKAAAEAPDANVYLHTSRLSELLRMVLGANGQHHGPRHVVTEASGATAPETKGWER